MRRKFGLLVGAIALVAVVSASSATVYAVSSVDTRCVAFIDEDGDGICDNCGDGIGFIDEDGDGIYDNWDAETGRGYGNGRGNGCGRNCWR